MRQVDLQCPWCGYSFLTAAELVDHMDWSAKLVRFPEDDVACLTIQQERRTWANEHGQPTDEEIAARQRHPSSRG